MPTPGGASLLNGVFPVSRYRAHPFRYSPQPLRTALQTLRPGVSFTSPASHRPLARLASYPSKGAFRCRFTSALRPAQDTHASGTSSVGFGAHFRKLSLPATFPSVRQPLLAIVPYETPRSFLRPDPPTESSCDSSVFHPILLPNVQPRIQILFTLR